MQPLLCRSTGIINLLVFKELKTQKSPAWMGGLEVNQSLVSEPFILMLSVFSIS